MALLATQQKYKESKHQSMQIFPQNSASQFISTLSVLTTITGCGQEPLFALEYINQWLSHGFHRNLQLYEYSIQYKTRIINVQKGFHRIKTETFLKFWW